MNNPAAPLIPLLLLVYAITLIAIAIVMIIIKVSSQPKSRVDANSLSLIFESMENNHE